MIALFCAGEEVGRQWQRASGVDPRDCIVVCGPHALPDPEYVLDCDDIVDGPGWGPEEFTEVVEVGEPQWWREEGHLASFRQFRDAVVEIQREPL